ncbi:hypothetical protein ABPG73_022750 [Tetrahymena malaccensis]
MNSANQNKKIKEGLLSHIDNRISVRKLYQDRGIAMLDKAQNIMSNMVDSQMDPNTQVVYENMKQELSEKDYEDFKYLRNGAQGLVILAKKGDKRYAIKGVQIKFLNGVVDQASLLQVESQIKLLTISGFTYAESLPNMSGYGVNEFVGNFYFMAPECYDPKKFDMYAIEYKNQGIVTKITPSQRSEACSLG